MYNKLILVGNITKDIELKYTQNNNKAVCNFDIAVNEYDTTEFFKVQCWGKTAENVSMFCKKGSKILVDGRLKTDHWEDKQSGKSRSKIYVVANRVVFLSTKVEIGNNNKIPELPNDAPPVEEDLPF